MILYFVNKLFQRSYSYLILSFLSLLIGSYLFGGVVSLTSSVRSFLTGEGKTLIGGDVVLRSSLPIATSSDALSKITQNGHILSEEKQVQAVFRTPDNQFTSPANVRIVGNSFPLYGDVIIQDGEYTPTGDGLYADQEFLNQLHIQTGDAVLLGSTTITVLGVLLKEPDTISLGLSFTPKVIVSQEVFRRSEIDLSQSRTSYVVAIKESSTDALTTTELEHIAEFASVNKIRLDDASDGPNRLLRGFSSVSTFIGIVLTIALFLVTVNIIANLVYILSRFKKSIALLKVFGSKNSAIRLIYIIILGLMGGVAGFLGSLGGAYSVTLGLPILETFIASELPTVNALYIAISGGIFGILFTLCAAAPFLSSLRHIYPKELLTGITRLSSRSLSSQILFYAPIPLLLVVLLYLISQDVLLVLYSVGGLLVLFCFYALITYFCVELAYAHRGKFTFTLSSIFSFLKWRGLQTCITTASIMTAFSGVFIISAVEHNIITNIAQNVSKTTPALYIVDIKRSQINSVRDIVGPTFKEYPIIRGRLLSVNSVDMTKSDNPGITREFNMTYRTELIEGERVVAGTFGTNPENPEVSIDKNFADEIGGVSLGDTITVFVQGITLSAKVTSIREVDTTRGIPFFYLVFTPSILRDFPSTYFGTAQASQEDIDIIKRTLSNQFPNVIPIETKKILDSVGSILATVVLIVSLTGLPSIVLGLILILVMIWQSLYDRRSDVLILRGFGFKKKHTTMLFILESGLLILLSGAIAYIVAHAVAYALNILVFSFNTFSFALQPLYVTLVCALLVIVFSYILSTRTAHDSLKKLLAEK